MLKVKSLKSKEDSENGIKEHSVSVLYSRNTKSEDENSGSELALLTNSQFEAGEVCHCGCTGRKIVPQGRIFVVVSFSMKLSESQ